MGLNLGGLKNHQFINRGHFWELFGLKQSQTLTSYVYKKILSIYTDAIKHLFVAHIYTLENNL